MNKKDEILAIIRKSDKISVKELEGMLPIGRVMIHRHLKKLIEENIIIRLGIPPKVYYSIKKSDSTDKQDYNIDNKTRKKIDNNFTLLEPNGNEIEGFDGFAMWCKERNYDTARKADEYVKLLDDYEKFTKDGFIDATSKIETSFNKEDKFLDKLYYLYPYSLPVFGKTKMGQWLFHAKQTQNKVLMKKVIDIVRPQIINFIKKERVDSVGFIPPTVPRNIQFMKELEKSLNLKVPIIKIEKIKMPIMIQQKGLKDLKDRIRNAEETMAIENNSHDYKNTLIIDDFTGSGSTLNIIARNIKKKKISDNVSGLTIAGSMNGFEVIKEV